MGLRSPFGYVGYEYQMAKMFAAGLDNFCAHCHTNCDYDSGCKECPVGVLLFACREYIREAIGGSEPEVVREMKACIKGIMPHPFFYVRYSPQRKPERPKRLVGFMQLTDKLKTQQEKRWEG